MASAGNHRCVEKRQNIAGFIERGDRIVVACQHDQMTTGLLQIDDKTVIQLTGVAWR